MYFVEIFFCLFCNFQGFATSKVQNLPARRRKTEKNKEVALTVKHIIYDTQVTPKASGPFICARIRKQTSNE
jgi:hypothetical protein